MNKHSKLEKWGMALVITPILISVLVLVFIMLSSSIDGGGFVPPNGALFLTALFWFFLVGFPIVLLGIFLIFRGAFLKSKENITK